MIMCLKGPGGWKVKRQLGMFRELRLTPFDLESNERPGCCVRLYCRPCSSWRGRIVRNSAPYFLRNLGFHSSPLKDLVVLNYPKVVKYLVISEMTSSFLQALMEVIIH
uniref:Uncharacterized protein n=1 Tax=Schistocephalus solidus TaxID=70667 RepID=A0A0X3PFJ8_SCHSO